MPNAAEAVGNEVRHERTKLSMRLMSSILDQAALSGFSFAVNLLLVRLWRPDLFGVFSVITALAMVGFGAQNALAGAQMVVLRPRTKDREDDLALLACLWTTSCVVMLASAAVTLVAVAFVWPDAWPALPLASGFLVGSMLLREAFRSVLFSELRIGTIFVVDLLFMGITAAGMGLLWIESNELDLASTCLVMGIANALASIGVLLRARRGLTIRLNRANWIKYRAIWQAQARWALFGVIGYEVISRAHVFVIGVFFGTAAVGILQAGAMMFRPLHLTLQAWGRVVQPTLARSAAVGDLVGSQRILHLSAAGAILLSLSFATGLWVVWPLFDKYVFKDEYLNIGTVVVLWGAATMVRLIAGVYSAQLEAIGRFRQLSVAEITGAAIALLALGGAIASGVYQFSILAALAGHLVELTLILIVLSQVFQQHTGNARSIRASSPWLE